MKNDWARTLMAQKAELSSLRTTLLDRETQLDDARNDLSVSLSMGKFMEYVTITNY